MAEDAADPDWLCDYLVVGAGAAGCVVAARLSENPANRVMLVEAGTARRKLVNRVPATAFLASMVEGTNWNFTSEPVPGLDGRRLVWSQGRMVGGSSSINGMLWMRGCPSDYDTWRQAGCPGWSYEDVLPVFRRIESSDRGDDALHGSSGPVPIRRSGLDLPVSDLFLDAIAGAGLPLVDDVNAVVHEGFGRFDLNIRDGRRAGAAESYLDPARDRANLRVLSDAPVLRLLFEGDRVVGAATRHGGVERRIAAAREVILCCGAVKTPQLLLLSGLGPAQELRSAGISVQRDIHGIGRNLHNHPAFALTYALREPISAYRYMSPLRGALAALRYATTRGGPLAESYVALGGLFRSDPSRDGPDLMVVAFPGLVKRAEVGARLSDVIERRHGFTVQVSLARQGSRGVVRLRSSDPAAPPVIEPNYYDDPADMTAMVAGVRTIRAAFRRPEVARHILTPLQPDVPDESPATLEAAIRTAGGTFYHPGGTCRMGQDPAAVVDARLRFRGVAGLRIADASVVPHPLSASMHAPSLMIGERAADFIREDEQDPARALAS